MNWSRVDYLWIIVMFLSAVWTLTAPIHCRGSIYLSSIYKLHWWKYVFKYLYPKTYIYHLFCDLLPWRFSSNRSDTRLHTTHTSSTSFHHFSLYHSTHFCLSSHALQTIWAFFFFFSSARQPVCRLWLIAFLSGYQRHWFMLAGMSLGLWTELRLEHSPTLLDQSMRLDTVRCEAGSPYVFISLCL